MSNLDMSLDDMIKANKKSRGSDNPRSKARNSGPGPSRRLPNRASNRSTPYGAQKVRNLRQSLIDPSNSRFYVLAMVTRSHQRSGVTKRFSI